MTQIVFHIEGGADRSQSGDMRKAFHDFFSDLHTLANANGSKIEPVVMHGSRSRAYKGFCHALKTHPEKYHVLLVDAEEPVKHWGECWRHLRERQDDGWRKPAGVTDAQCHLMVQAIEAWFFADPDALKTYYGQGFPANFSGRLNVEEIPKDEHISKLEAATRQTQKGIYHKTRHLPDLLGKIDASKVRERAWHCDRIFLTLSKRFGTELPPLCTLSPEP